MQLILAIGIIIVVGTVIILIEELTNIHFGNKWLYSIGFLVGLLIGLVM